MKNIKAAIYNIQTDIEEINGKIDALTARIQSISFVPDYSDGRATMYYTNGAGTITPGSTTLRFEIQPSSAASDLVAVWSKALSLKAVYTMTRASVGETVELPISSVTASDGILTIVASGANLDESYFRSGISANVRLLVSSGSTQKSSEYISMVPWTTDRIYIPDANFKSYLVDNFDTDGDGEISEEEALAVTEIDIAASLATVRSLAGVEYFVNLERLDCSYNRLTSLDLSRNTNLKELNASNNSLESMDLGGCASLKTLDCSRNRIQTLTVSGLKSLETLNCANNKLVSFNVSQNKELKKLDCGDNSLAALNVSNCRLLTELRCANNQLTAIDLTKNTELVKLDCSGNALKALDLTKVSKLAELSCGSNALTHLFLGNCTALKKLDCKDNALTGLDLSACTGIEAVICAENALVQLDVTKLPSLANLDCSGNALKSLNVSCNATLLSLDCCGNASLEKLWLKDSAQQDALTLTKDDATAIFFNNGGINIPDQALKSYLLNIYDDDDDGQISIAEADNIISVNCSGKGITDLTGLECCTNLVTVNCANNGIAEMDLHTLTRCARSTVPATLCGSSSSTTAPRSRTFCSKVRQRTPSTERC